MPVNADKPQRWKADIARSIDAFNAWFLKLAPRVFRDARRDTARQVMTGMSATDNLRSLSPAVLKENPGVLSLLRMATCPPLARDRLAGLAHVRKSLIHTMEEKNRIPPRVEAEELCRELARICDIIGRLLDRDLFTWLDERRGPARRAVERATTVVADRLCGCLADPILRNAQEKRQLARIGDYLDARGYRRQTPRPEKTLCQMPAGTYCFRMNLRVVREGAEIKIPIDAVIQPHSNGGNLPILVEAKSAGDFTNTNKRRKEEAAKIHQLRARLGDEIRFVLFLCGYFDSGYLGYEAAEGIDWVWEHRIEDFLEFGV
ncbi:MAG: XamI family restriction endonuclease [Phycisphaerae bacterium]|jgi:hypothetical protein